MQLSLKKINGEILHMALFKSKLEQMSVMDS